VSAFTQSGCSINPSVGGAFSLFGGNVTGEFVELVPNNKIVQKWRFSQWPEGYYSTVYMNFESSQDGMFISLKQTGVPADDLERAEKGWTDHYFRRMKMMFGWGNMYGD